MSTSKPKKTVRYEHGTKPGTSHRSRDSGVGSSSASDRASLGEAPNESPFNSQELDRQRHSVRALQEALDAANERIKRLESRNAQLDASLSESNKENRLLKREKADLMNNFSLLEDKLDEQKKLTKQLKRESLTRSSPPSSSGSDKRSSPPRSPKREHAAPKYHREDDRASHGSHGSHRRESGLHSAPNPFAPLPSRRASVSYPPPGPITYAPATLSYSATPVYAVSHAHPHHSSYGDDGRYHLSPL